MQQPHSLSREGRGTCLSLMYKSAWRADDDDDDAGAVLNERVMPPVSVVS